MASIAMPRWLRLVVVASVVILVTGAGLFGYRWYSRPTTLTIAVGSLDGEAAKLVSALASNTTACEGMSATCRKPRQWSSSRTPWCCLSRPRDLRSPTSQT